MTRRVGFTCTIGFAAVLALGCSTGDPDTMPADPGNRIQRTTAKVDSSLNRAREHIRTIDTLGGSVP